MEDSQNSKTAPVPAETSPKPSKCLTCDGFGSIGDGPFSMGTECPDCNGSGTVGG